MAAIHEALRAWADDPIAARRQLRELAADGDPRAQCAYALMLAEGRGGGTDPAAAVTWLRRAAEQDHAVACYSLAAAFAEGRGTAPDPEEALRWYRRAADLGDPDALHALGLLAASGHAADPDPHEAVRWWRRAAARGVTAALRSLGHAHVATDLPQAAAWYLEAAIAGDDASVEALARILPRVRAAVDEGSGPAAWVAAAFADGDEERARLGALAVSRGDARACCAEGRRVLRGQAPGGPETALALFERAAAAGSEEAAHELATARATGAGVPRDLRAAVEDYRRAAAWGRPASVFGLGAALIELGEDRDEALDALRRAALGGFPAAMGLYAAQIAETDPVEALRWLFEAEAEGLQSAGEAARQLAATLSRDDVVRADRRSRTDGVPAAALLAGSG